MRFAGKSVIVSGAASGIGLATARAFAREGAQVALADRDTEGAERAVAQIADEGGMAIAMTVDVCDPASCRAMVAATVAAFGKLDIAFNNAGVPAIPGVNIADVALADWSRVIETNISGVFHAMQVEIPALRAAGGGAIVNTASTASFESVPGMAAYIASKHGVAGLTKAAALELIGENIRVNAVCPGMTMTAMMAPLVDDPQAMEAMKAMAPIHRLADPAEIAQGVLFLASDAASYAVGTLLRLDGGLTLT